MKIAFDLHGTLDSNPELFNIHIKELLFNNHEIFILSGSPELEINELLNDLNFEFIEKFNIISMVDYLKGTKAINYWFVNDKDDKKHIFFDDCVWWPLKSFLCDKYKINFLIDDKQEYQKYFGETHLTKFLLYDNSFNFQTLKELINN